MPISARSAKTIWGQFAQRCAICRKLLIYEDEGRTPSLVGEVAHIVGETPSAARGKSELSSKDRNKPDNLILLCREHHKIVDDYPDEYTVNRLHEEKDKHLQWIAESLESSAPWRSPIAQLTYINVPRLCEYALQQGHHVNLSAYQQGQTLHSLGWELNRVMSAFLRVLSRLTILARSSKALTLHERFIGHIVVFDREHFRTKGVPLVTDDGTAIERNRRSKTYSHIYLQTDDFRIILPIDPTWITTDTAFTLFRSGHAMFTGFGRVTNVDYETQVITVTPLALGIPDGIGSGFAEAAHNSTEIQSTFAALDELVDMVRARNDATYFISPPTHCDMCGKDFSSEKYMIDGQTTTTSGPWAFMCAACFAKHGVRIEWGYGQLYMREQDQWLEVAGFPPLEHVSEI